MNICRGDKPTEPPPLLAQKTGNTSTGTGRLKSLIQTCVSRFSSKRVFFFFLIHWLLSIFERSHWENRYLSSATLQWLLAAILQDVGIWFMCEIWVGGDSHEGILIKMLDSCQIWWKWCYLLILTWANGTIKSDVPRSTAPELQLAHFIVREWSRAFRDSLPISYHNVYL